MTALPENMTSDDGALSPMPRTSAALSITEGPKSPKGLDLVTALLNEVKIETAHSAVMIDTPATMAKLVDDLEGLPIDPPSLYIDLEGENLSREGTISILQLYLRPKKATYLIDIFKLREQAFTTLSGNGRTFRQILEDARVPKVIFDVRNDSDALHTHYGVQLAGIQDLQLMELATRNFSRRHVNGLARCIERDASLSFEENRKWKTCKDKGVHLFAPERGGSYKVFNDRPLREEIREYCVQDVHFLPRLWDCYNRKLSQTWRKKVTEATMGRVDESQSSNYVPHGQHKALAPLGWA
jgi:exonuclease 3'-5' domain-containing protein 1